jgi:hypothetical protein
VRRKLRHSLFEAVWGLLLREGYVEDVLYGAQDGDWLVARAREILNARTPVTERVETSDGEPSAGQERAWALSQLVAHYAKEDPGVVAFRAKHLNAGLIRWANVEKWISEASELDGDRSASVTLTLPTDTTIESNPDGTRKIDPPIAKVVGRIKYSVGTLAYALPGDRSVRRLAVTSGGVLDRLSRLADSLADSFGWNPAQATVFILAGVTPLIAPVRVTTPAVKIRYGTDVGWARRITLDVDPAATPQEVLDAFTSARDQHSPTSRRRLSVKHLRLAAFAGAEHADKPWAERHRLWNEKFPEWAYPAESNFRRDAAVAQRRVLYPLG